MKNIKLVLGFLSIVIIYYILNNSEFTLACGLFGFVGIDSKNNFSWDKFNILGLYNDSRGGDACGRVIGGVVQWGVGALKEYKNFATTVKNIRLPDKYSTVLGHCRKASSGGKDDIYAQPIVLKKKDLNFKAIRNTQLKSIIKGLDPEEIIFSGIHNGTIDNYIELARRYGIPLEDHNDSKVLLSILFYGNTEVLGEYNGTAALVWHNHISNKTYFFKGESKYSANSTVDSEERPLYYWEISKSNYYFSSIEDSLMFIGAEKEQVNNMKTNTLYIFKEGAKVEEVKVDRHKSVQSNKSNYYNSTEYDDDAWYKNRYGYSRHSEFDNNHKRFEENRSMVSLPLPKSVTKVAVSEDTKKSIRVFSIQKDEYRIQGEILDSFLALTSNRVAYNKGRYWMHGGLLHGIYVLSNSGIIPAVANKESSPIGLYYFIEGIMMDSYKSYNLGLAIHYEMMQELKADCGKIVDAERDFISDIAQYAENPISTLTNFTDTQDFTDNVVTDPKKLESFYSGSFTPTFSDKRYAFYKGELVSIIEARTPSRADHKDDDIVLCNTYNARCVDLKETDRTFTIGYDIMYHGKSNPFSPFQNIVFSSVDLKTTKDVDMILFILNYMRDFRPIIRLQCASCIFRDESISRTCVLCETLTQDLDKQIPLIADYGVFND
jgi:hypothetical protein